MNLLIVLHFDLLPFFLGSLTDIVLMARAQRVPGTSRGGNWHQSWIPGPPSSQHHLQPRPPPPDITQGRKPVHSVFYFLKLYTNVKYFNSKSMGKLFGFKLL